MARTVIAAVTPKGPFPDAVAANDLDVAETAADAANKQSTPYTGKEVILARNTGVGARTVTFTAKADPYGATSHVTAYSIGAGELAVFSFRDGAPRWQQSDGNIYFEAEHAEVLFTVLRIP